MRALRFAVAGLAVLVEAVVAVALVFGSNRDENPWLVAAFATIAGVSFVAAGLVALWRRPDNATGLLLAATGYLWFVAALTESNETWGWTVGFVFGNLAFVTFAATILAFPDGRLTGATTGSSASVAARRSSATPSSPSSTRRPRPAARSARRARSPSPRAPGSRGAVIVVGSAVVGVVLVWIAVILVQRWRRASLPQRRVLRPVFLSCGAAIGLLLISVLAEQIGSRAYSLAWVLFLIAFAAVPLTFLGRRPPQPLRPRGRGPDPALARRRRSPARRARRGAPRSVARDRVPARRRRRVGRRGRAAGAEEPRATAERAVTMIERNGRAIAALVHDPALADEQETIDLVASAAGLPLENTRLQADLRSQFQFLVTLVNTAPSLFVHLDTEGRIVNQNIAAVEAAGYDDEEELRGRHFWDVFIDPLLREEVVRRFREAAPAHPGVEYEDTFVNRRGERRVVYWRSAPLLDEEGNTRGIIAGGIDVTARHEEAEGRERERVFLNAIANEAPSLLCLIDESGVLAPLASNKSFERTLEVSPQETGGTVFWDAYVAPEDAAQVRALVARVAAGETVGYNDHTWITKSGRRVAVSWSCIRLPAIDERRLLLVSGVDVTERKQREIQLQHERDITSTLMNAIPSIVVVVDREGVIVDSGVDESRAGVNEEFRTALGWPDEQIVRTSVLDLIDPEDGVFARMAIASAANGVASSRASRAGGGRTAATS